ncbi:glycerophosphoryl diester phosphodiesterase [Chitinophaga sp. Cy-1792]|uniref:glycerophosphoryl diester phosphodiesterase n=1 Tax=Chitinophaga sp. Cy-1792 TaxID=2608339 RepID=UPI0014247288|nr:glycerophosphoryl diester phosphodiesterase [Chitinophaga sp. Cy-1792]NIG55318.1 glycerophosphoryl diester phosphodiesterase [Chitinophaga sp. Cy-1792]
MRNCLLLLSLLICPGVFAQQRLQNEQLTLEWKQTSRGYQLQRIVASGQSLPQPSGEYLVIYSAGKPDSIPDLHLADGHPGGFSLKDYIYLTKNWENNLSPVAMNTAGKAIHFFPATAKQNNGILAFNADNTECSVNASWQLDKQYKNDILVSITLTAKQAGYYSIASPTLATLAGNKPDFAMLPGYFQSNTIQPDLVLAYAYGQGIPDKPVVFRERTAATLSPLVSSKGITMAVIPAPGTARDPWEKDVITQAKWKLGLSVMNRQGQYTPVAYHPVLGQEDSYMHTGEQRTFSFRYTVQPADWYTVYKHAINDVYRFPEFLKLKNTHTSLTSRIMAMLHYLGDDSTSMWHTFRYKGLEIGAQAYMGGVVGAEHDAMKNSDYGAMWMLANITQDTTLLKHRLPAALNFKLVQQQEDPGFFQGAAIGQYYLWKRARFTEEWGHYVEPIALTYYTMLDIGNILLFEPGNAQLQQRLRLGADKLLQWQHTNGHWEVAYDDNTAPTFTDIPDLRPTFYGLVVAYRILKDEKYLLAARKGADWLIKNGIDKGSYLGVCGDTRFVADFATAQTVQAMLDIFDITKDKRYQDAAITAAKVYTASVYTHPIPDMKQKTVNGTPRQDWEISQVGLSFEHGGSLGSANNHGPIMLASHAGMFVRIFALTHDSLFINMARAAVLGRDAFVDQATQVASYYWMAMNKGAGPYPHHAWWQVGLLTDYLVSEISLRSNNRISFPKGFVTPKVGPHTSYGFAPGQVLGAAANLYLPDGMLEVRNPQVDYLSARSTDRHTLYIMLLNSDDDQQQTAISFDPSKAGGISPNQVTLLDAAGKPEKQVLSGNTWNVTIPAYGLKIIKIRS